MKRRVPDIVDAAERDKLDKAARPDWVSPMLATLTHDHFSDPDWIYERKLDGERALAFCSGNNARLMTRNRKNINANYPEIHEALERLDGELILDGEIVAFEGRLTSFSRLQQRMQITDADKARASKVKVWYYVFDILYLDGYRLERLPLRSRKKLLRAAIDTGGPLRFTGHRNRDGEKFLDEACGKGWEGLIAKDATSSYVHSRSRSWLKFKCGNSQELVIGGFTAPKGSRAGFGALLVGYYDDGDLCYAGKVGTGYDDDFLVRFRARLDRIARKESPFSKGSPKNGDITWVKPELVGEFGFTEWTRDGKLRHPRFLGLRRDKPAKQVVREEPAE